MSVIQNRVNLTLVFVTNERVEVVTFELGLDLGVWSLAIEIHIIWVSTSCDFIVFIVGLKWQTKFCKPDEPLGTV